MKKFLFPQILALCFLSSSSVSSQPYVWLKYDVKLTAAWTTNAAASAIADKYMINRWSKIQNAKRIQLENLTLVDLIQERIFNSLTKVDRAIRQGKSVVEIGNIIRDILNYTLQASSEAKGNPALVLFAEQSAREFKQKGIDLSSYLYGFILKEKKDLLMDAGKRDMMIRHVLDELCVLRGLAYSIYNTIRWAKLNGFLQQVNPWQSYITTDKQLVQGILSTYKF